MAETAITIVGNLTADPEVRELPSGVSVANFTVASTPRVYDKQSGEWKDGDTLFLRVNAWRQFAEGAADSLVKGDTVSVVGKLKQKNYENRDGEKRSAFEVEAEFVGKSVVPRRGATGGGWGGSAAADDAPF
ncbi:single-stranded DNA-binding protein [Mycobacteroides abscessus]|uniref:single-stranded DNA-binding protein n=1 Tax=Mycobacteroides abscessus TaxID=36809 RepID=UPI001896972B|nr:single-stranded DNA-binding protein [Mycobacteroides abscessus]